jgi:hypothetical protein
MRYTPGPILFFRLDALASDEREHPDGVLLCGSGLFTATVSKRAVAAATRTN